MDFRWGRDYARYFYLGLMFPSSIAVGAAMGWLLERWLGIEPWGIIGGFFFGVAAGALNFYRDYKKLTSKKKNESGKS